MTPRIRDFILFKEKPSSRLAVKRSGFFNASCVFVFPFLFLSGCVSLDNEAFLDKQSVAKSIESPYGDLDPGAKTHETIHFLVKAYSIETARKYSSLCERNYQRIMSDMGLYSFVPARPYNIVVFRDAAEYRRKTGQPNWSGGITYGNAILVYESKHVESILAHEMTHLIFNEFMGLSSIDKLRWINEGLAVYEERRSSPETANYHDKMFRNLVVPNPIGFSQMMNIVPFGEENTIVKKWYMQVGDVAGFIVQNGGSMGLYIFLKELKEGRHLDDAIKTAFTGKWKNMDELEKSWLISVQK